MAIGSTADAVSGQHVQGGQGSEHPLLSGCSGFFELRNRPRRDVPWLVAYLLILLTALGGGIFSFLHRNTKYAELALHGISDPSLCPITVTSHATLRQLQQGPDAPSPFSLDLFMRAAGAWVGASVGGAILVGLLFVWLVRSSPAALVTVALSIQIAIPACMGIVALSQHLIAVGVSLMVMAGMMVLLFLLWRPQIEQVSRLLGLAGRSLSSNPGLVPLALGLQVGLVTAFELPLLVAAVAAVMNGALEYNQERIDRGVATTEAQCRNESGDMVPCCVWQVEPWVPGYMTLSFVAMTWSMFLVFQIKMYTVAGATAQWYFAAAEDMEDVTTTVSGSSSSWGRPVRRSRPSRTLTSFRFAVGPSLGSLCCSSAVLTLVALVRQALEKFRRERGSSLVAACAAACLSFLLSLVEYVTRFATVWTAITGDAFLSAGHGVVELLKRNAMDAFGVWWLPPMILQSCSFLLALSWAVTVFLTSYTTTWSHQAATSPDQATASALITAVIAFLVTWAVLAFLTSVLLNVVDALFVCFAMDRDVGQVSSLEVHTVMSKLPTVGAVVQQPDGGIVYGAPPEQQQGLLRGSVARA